MNYIQLQACRTLLKLSRSTTINQSIATPKFSIRSYSKITVVDDRNWISIPRITVCGVGGGGCNSVNNMIKKQLYGVDFVVANTDAQALAISDSEKVVQLGKVLTRGLGAGAVPDIGRRAAEESLDELMEQVGDTQMLFVTAGMGGGTGTGAAAVVAAAAKARGILTVGIVTKPFLFEGRHRMKLAESGLAALESAVDSLIVLPNQRLMEVQAAGGAPMSINQAFSMVDDVLYNGVKGISDILVKPGLINLDFADVRSIMCDSGKTLMGTGEAEGQSRDLIAAEQALNNPLLENIDIAGAKGVLLNISGSDVTLAEVDQIVSLVSSRVDPSANIIFGSTLDPELSGKVRVTLIVTGINNELINQKLESQVNLNMNQQAQQVQQQVPQQAPQQQVQFQSQPPKAQAQTQPQQGSSVFSGSIKQQSNLNQQQLQQQQQQILEQQKPKYTYPYQQFQAQQAQQAQQPLQQQYQQPPQQQQQQQQPLQQQYQQPPQQQQQQNIMYQQQQQPEQNQQFYQVPPQQTQQKRWWENLI